MDEKNTKTDSGLSFSRKQRVIEWLKNNDQQIKKDNIINKSQTKTKDNLKKEVEEISSKVNYP